MNKLLALILVPFLTLSLTNCKKETSAPVEDVKVQSVESKETKTEDVKVEDFMKDSTAASTTEVTESSHDTVMDTTAGTDNK